jgi:MFS family permease
VTRGGGVARFLAGTGLSGFGDWLTTFALAVVLYGDTKSVAATAGYFLVRVAPRPVGAWLGGPLGDLISPRLALLGAALLQGILTAGIAIPLATHRAIWSVYLLAGLSQLVGGSWQPLTAALMARLATGGKRHTINLLYMLLSGSAMLVSPAIGALLLAPLGAVPLVLTDAATFAVAALLFVSLAPMPGGTVNRLTLRGAAAGGFVAASRLRTLRVIAVGALASTLAITALQTALPALADQRFGSTADAGFLYAMVGLGSMVGALLALWPPARRPGVILPGIALEIAGIGGVAIVGAPAGDLLILAVSTVAASLSQVEGGVVVQSQPPGLVGRIQGAVSTSRFVGMAGGAAIALILASTVRFDPERLVLVLAAVGLLLLFASALGPGDREPATSGHETVSPLLGLPE